MRPEDCELCETPKSTDPRRKDIGFDEWIQFKGASATICRPTYDNLILYSEAQMRQAWVEGYRSAERYFAAGDRHSTKEQS